VVTPAPGGAEESSGAQDDQETSTEDEGEPAEDAAADSYAEDLAGDDGAKVEGSLNLRYRARWTDEDEDQDLYGVAAVDITTGGKDPFLIHLLGRGAWDMDGQAHPDPFYGVDDSYGSSVTGRLYYAYVDAPIHALDLTRVGRQVNYDTPVVTYFDGARLEISESSPMGLMLGAYGGLSTHLFETSHQGDFTGGVYTSLNPWVGGRLRFDYLHLQDETNLGDHNDDLLAVGLKHNVGRNLDLEGKYTWLEAEDRDLTLRGNWFWPEQDLSVRASYYRLLQSQGDLSLELNPFYNTLRTLYPYDQTQLQLSKGLGDFAQIFGGVDFRRVDDEGDIGQFNRDFDRYHLSLALLDLLPLSTTVSFRGEMWDSPQNDISSWGLDVDSELGEGFKTLLGTYYSLYKYYLDLNLEREDVRTYYVELRKELFDATDWNIRYEYEDAEYNFYHTLRMGMTWRF